MNAGNHTTGDIVEYDPAQGIPIQLRPQRDPQLDRAKVRRDLLTILTPAPGLPLHEVMDKLDTILNALIPNAPR